MFFTAIYVCDVVRWIVMIILMSCGPKHLGKHGTIQYRERHGVFVIPNGWPIDRQELEGEIERTTAAWEKVLGPGVRRILKETYVVWESFPFVHNGCPVHLQLELPLCTGLYVPAEGRVLLVGFRTPLVATALAHELGHLFLHKLCNTHDETSLAAFTTLHGLPY